MKAYQILVLVLFILFSCQKKSNNTVKAPNNEEISLVHKPDREDGISKAVNDTMPDSLIDRIMDSNYYKEIESRYSKLENTRVGIWYAPEGSSIDSLLHFQIVLDGPDRVYIIKEIFYSVNSNHVFERDNIRDTLILLDNI